MSQLRNKYLKNRFKSNRLAYSEQINFCMNLLKTRKDYYPNLSEEDVADYKNFWKTIRPLLLDKIESFEKICLVKGEKLVTNDKENANIFSKFFSNTVKNLRIPDFTDTEPLADNISHSTLKTIMNGTIQVFLKLKKKCRKTFKFSGVSIKDIVEKIKKLSTKNSVHSTDIPLRIIQEKNNRRYSPRF